MAGNISEDTPRSEFTCAHCGARFEQPDGFATVCRCPDCIKDFAERFWRTMGTHTPATGTTGNWIER